MAPLIMANPCLIFRSTAALGRFEVNDMQMQMVGESIEFYRDRERLSSSEEEGEETDSIMMDQG